MTITFSLIQMVEKIAEKSDKARINTKAQVTELIMSGGVCTGCIYEKGGTIFKEFDPVFFTSGEIWYRFRSEFIIGNVTSRVVAPSFYERRTLHR